MRTATLLVVSMILLPGFSGAARAAAQTEIDRIVSRVNNVIITQTDVQQAMQLKLVEDPTSEDSTRRGLEERMLILGEIGRQPALPPLAAEDLSARRSEWEASVGGRSSGAALLVRAAMKETAIAVWFTDDVRIRMHLTRQFGSLPDEDRARAVADWVARLRQRAGLK